MTNLSQFIGGGRIKSIQRGTIVLPTPPNSPSTVFPGYVTQTATISPVNTSKSILFVLGQQNGQTFMSIPAGFGNNYIVSGALLTSLQLTNSTTITATSGYHYGNTSGSGGLLSSTVPPVVSWQLVEYY